MRVTGFHDLPIGTNNLAGFLRELAKPNDLAAALDPDRPCLKAARRAR